MSLEVVLQRLHSNRAERTPGELYLNGIFFCYTLEDAVREVAGEPVWVWKIAGQTAIPVGRYGLTLENSPRFGPETPTIVKVPGFTGVRIHGGNTEEDTEGCPLVGYTLTPDETIAAGQSRAALANLKRNLKHFLKQGPLFIEIRNPT